MYYPASRYVFHIQPLHINPFQFLWWANSKNLVSLNFSGAVLAFIWSFWGCREEVLQNDDEYDSYLRPGLGVGPDTAFWAEKCMRMQACCGEPSLDPPQATSFACLGETQPP